DVRERCGARSARKDELLQSRQVGIVVFEQLVEPRDTRIRQVLQTGNAQLAAEVEQVVLDVGERGADRLRQRLALQDADRRIQLVDTAYGLDPRAVLGGPAAVAQPGRTVVAGAGGDRGESESHHCL